MNHAIRSLSLVSLVLGASCHSSHDNSKKPNTIGGGGSGPYLEVEINDDAWNANWVGEIRAGDFIPIEGFITECCPDPYDGFSFFTYEAVRLRMTLFESQPGADLDFAIYIPEIDGVVAAFETDNHPEFGVFDFVGPGEFHIVVRSFSGDSNYRLEVDVRPLPFALSTGPDTPDASPSPFSLEAFSGYAKASSEPVLQVAPLLPDPALAPEFGSSVDAEIRDAQRLPERDD